MAQVRLMAGISVFWLALSMLFDGLNTLVLPQHLFGLANESSRATALGIVTFVGLLLGMLVQPVAGVLSDRLRPRWGRRGTVTLGVLLTLIALALFGLSRTLLAVLLSYLLLQVITSVAQAAQQGFIPDLVPAEWRGTASGLKGMMDLGGALLGFIVLGYFLREGNIGPALVAIATVLISTLLLTIILVPEHAQPLAPQADGVDWRGAFKLDLHRRRAFAWLIGSRFLFLLGTYMVGRFLLYFIADRLGLDPGQAAEQSGLLLAGLTLVSILAAPLTGWAADRFGRAPLMKAGAGLSAVGVLLLIPTTSSWQIFLFGGLMALGSAAFAGANWALTADMAPPAEAARFMALANFGTAGAAAAAGLFGPAIDGVNRLAPGAGYTVLFSASALAFFASVLALRGLAEDPAGSQEYFAVKE